MGKGQQLPPVEADSPTKPAYSLPSGHLRVGIWLASLLRATTKCCILPVPWSKSAIQYCVDLQARPLSGPLFLEECGSLNLPPIRVVIVVTS